MRISDWSSDVCSSDLIERQAPAFGACLRCYRRAVADGDEALASGLIAWMSGQPNVAATVKRTAGIKGDIDHFGALGFLQGLLLILRDSGDRKSTRLNSSH